MKRRLRALDLFKDVRSFGGPDKGLGVLVVMSDVGLDGVNQLGNAMEDATANALSAEVPKESFDHIQPGSTGGGEVHLHTGMTLQPALHFGMLVGRIVIRYDMQRLLRRRFGIEQFQEAQPLAMRVAVHALADNATVQRIKGGEQS